MGPVAAGGLYVTTVRHEAAYDVQIRRGKEKAPRILKDSRGLL
jgi:hypothetical protein